MLLHIKKESRFGYSAGCWWITKTQAQKLCKEHGVQLPRIGHDRSLFDNKFRAYISNIAGSFQLNDESRLIDVHES